MKESKYIKLLADTQGLNTSIKFHEQQLENFSKKCSNIVTEINNSLDNIGVNLQPLSTLMLPLAVTHLEQVHGAQRIVEQLKKRLHKDYEKPGVQYKKSLEKISKELFGKIESEIKSIATPCAFDLNSIQLIINDSKPTFASCEQHLNSAIATINTAQEKISRLEATMQRLDLPHELQQTTKQVEKISQELARLNLHVTVTPNTLSEYKAEFLPLRNALVNLQKQSISITGENIDQLAVTTATKLSL